MLSLSRGLCSAPAPAPRSTAKALRAWSRTDSRSARPSCRRPVRPATALPGGEGGLVPLDEQARSQLPSWLTLAGCITTEAACRTGLASFQLAAPHLYRALAWYTLAWGALAALERGPVQFEPIATVVGPMFLAASALNFFGGRVTPFQTAAALLGFFWIDHLPTFAYSRPVWLATLAAAIYWGRPAQWLVAAFGLGALWRLVQRKGAGGLPPVQELAFAGLAGWAFYKRAEMPMALMMMAAHMAASLVS